MKDQFRKFSIISVFTDEASGFRGNTAAVIMLSSIPDKKWMKSIAADFNQPAITFLWPGEKENSFGIRWYAPDGEINLCGHGTMAATAFLAGMGDGKFDFQYADGFVHGLIENGKCSIILEPIPIKRSLPVPVELKEGLSAEILEYYETENKNLVVLSSEQEVKNLKPDFSRLRESEVFGYAVTAPGEQVDFVSRTLVPHVQQLEDHATGSSHAILVPFWSERLGKNSLVALQHSPRGGKFSCELRDEGVVLSGDYEIIAVGSLSNKD